jgi:hypothetical protein
MSSFSPHLSSRRRLTAAGPRPSSIGLAIRVLLRRSRLDELLLSGVEPEESPELTLRAAQLTGSHHRRVLADSLARAVRVAEGSGRRLSAAPRLACGEVHAARAALRELESALRSDAPVEPAGVVLAERMLTDGTGPLYIYGENDALWHAAKCASAALEGYGWG